MSPEFAPLSAAFLSALKSLPFSSPSPSKGATNREGFPAEEESDERGQVGLIPVLPESLVEPLVGAFSTLAMADTSDKRDRCGRSHQLYFVFLVYLFFPRRRFCSSSLL